jgi:saccharopine dehydrogenase (NAD+, L-lysine-forming)
MVREDLLPSTGFLHQENIPLEMFLNTPTGSLFKTGAPGR